MRNPEKVLNSLSEHSKDSTYKFERLYRILFNEEMFYIAYQRIYAKQGNMTKGSDGQTIDNMSLTRIEKLINSLKDESYQPKPSRRVYIPKKNGEKRPLGVPAFNDKLVQEVLRMVLEAIYEGNFSRSSHGFRPNKSCHTALMEVKMSFGGTKWFIEGDIKGFFDNISHDILINTLQKRIKDERFIRLIRKFLNAGYIEDWRYYGTFSGTPQGGIISPILANIYLNMLDEYVTKYIAAFDNGKERKPSKESQSLRYKRDWAMNRIRNASDEHERKEWSKQLQAIRKLYTAIPRGDEMDENFRRLKYVRYADDFICGVIGSKKDAEKIKEDIKTFLMDQLSLELSDEKTLITHSEKSAKFLGYEIDIRKSNEVKRNSNGRLRRSFNKTVRLRIGQDVLKKKLLDYNVLDIRMHNGKEQWKPKTRPMLSMNEDLEILSQYNQEIRGLHNYYALAVNCSSLHQFVYIMQYSMYKTFAQKYRTTVPKICQKYKRNGIFTVQYRIKNGILKERTFYNESFKRQDSVGKFNVDVKPLTAMYNQTTSLIDRLKSEECELCGSTGALVMHHVRKLGELEGKTKWDKHMIARRRKTIAVCKTCHQRIHLGKSID
ncbi:MAG: reverse transcriptase domain-containing protein [Muribaculaceae bacterium]